ncbi:MAG: hypothetical protein IPG12_14090 [Saprospiraceae bacterium]|nr:hypothetical protein [Saprospiraceae bacterium]
MKKYVYVILLSIAILSCSKDNQSCPLRYTGNDSDIQITPQSILVEGINLKTFPLLDNGVPWDLLDDPDLYIVITYNGLEIYSTRSNVKLNSAGSSATWAVFPALFLDEPLNKYSIGVFDYDDLNGDDFIGGISFTPYSSNNNFPFIIDLSCVGCNTEWSLLIKYQF